jgi:hypothetical protein
MDFVKAFCFLSFFCVDNMQIRLIFDNHLKIFSFETSLSPTQIDIQKSCSRRENSKIYFFLFNLSAYLTQHESSGRQITNPHENIHLYSIRQEIIKL